jgi:dUTP pyrophosphatase
MIYDFSALEFSVGDQDLMPTFQTPYASAADIYCARDTEIMPGSMVLVPTGLFIYHFDLEKWGHTHVFPDLQIRTRSVTSTDILPESVYTIDIDYRDEIRVPLLNLSTRSINLRYSQKIAQLVMSVGYRHPQLVTTGFGRTGGFDPTEDSTKAGEPAE